MYSNLVAIKAPDSPDAFWICRLLLPGCHLAAWLPELWYWMCWLTVTLLWHTGAFEYKTTTIKPLEYLFLPQHTLLKKFIIAEIGGFYFSKTTLPIWLFFPLCNTIWKMVGFHYQTCFIYMTTNYRDIKKMKSASTHQPFNHCILLCTHKHGFALSHLQFYLVYQPGTEFRDSQQKLTVRLCMLPFLCRAVLRCHMIWSQWRIYRPLSFISSLTSFLFWLKMSKW